LGNAGDVAELAKNKWPLSIKTSVSDFHPNETGYAAIAQWIYDALLARGWI
jgi:lysophospholipase L1-like esterase